MLRLLVMGLLVVACEKASPNGDTEFSGDNSSNFTDEVTPEGLDVQVEAVVAEEEPKFEVIPSDEQEAFLAFTSCLDLKNKIPDAPNGLYKLYQRDQDNQPVFYDAYCDMESENGGWTMVLNYVHLGGTNPPLQIMNDKLPKFNLNNLGDDEQNTENFGHASPEFLASWQFTELRFYCRSSGHNRVLHFSTDSATCIDYLKTGVGNCDDVANNFTALTGHTATIPADQANGTDDAAANAMVDRTFRDANSDENWDIRHGNGEDDWECDDDVDNSSNNTIHRVWFR